MKLGKKTPNTSKVPNPKNLNPPKRPERFQGGKIEKRSAKSDYEKQ